METSIVVLDRSIHNLKCRSELKMAQQVTLIVIYFQMIE